MRPPRKDAEERVKRENERLRRELAERDRQIAEQAKRIADLERQLALRNQNSTTTSKPPASDGLAGRQRARGRRHKSRRQPGPGQQPSSCCPSWTSNISVASNPWSESGRRSRDRQALTWSPVGPVILSEPFTIAALAELVEADKRRECAQRSLQYRRRFRTALTASSSFGSCQDPKTRTSQKLWSAIHRFCGRGNNRKAGFERKHAAATPQLSARRANRSRHLRVLPQARAITGPTAFQLV